MTACGGWQRCEMNRIGSAEACGCPGHACVGGVCAWGGGVGGACTGFTDGDASDGEALALADTVALALALVHADALTLAGVYAHCVAFGVSVVSG